MAKFPEGQRCHNCRYGETRRSETHRCCVRYPPTVINDDGEGRWASVSFEFWCGEWAPENPETIDEGCAIMARLVLLGDLTAARALADKLRE